MTSMTRTEILSVTNLLVYAPLSGQLAPCSMTLTSPTRSRQSRQEDIHSLKSKKKMKQLLIMVVIMTSVVMASCNVTRTITTKSEYWQKADTSVVIQTKTIETYDASRK